MASKFISFLHAFHFPNPFDMTLIFKEKLLGILQWFGFLKKKCIELVKMNGHKKIKLMHRHKFDVSGEIDYQYWSILWRGLGKAAKIEVDFSPDLRTFSPDLRTFSPDLRGLLFRTCADFYFGLADFYSGLADFYSGLADFYSGLADLLISSFFSYI